MLNGDGSLFYCLARMATPAGPERTIGGSLKGCCGSCARERHGAICRRRSVSGPRYGSASADGRSRAYSSGFSWRCRTIRMSNTRSLTARSSRFTGTAPAQKGTQNQAIGRSRGGLTTKIVALVDALGNLARFVLLPGQRHDSIGVEPLITGVDFDALIADKAFDNDALRAILNERGAIAVVPAKSDRKTPIPHDVEIYGWRHLVENFLSAQGVPPDRYAIRQDRRQLRRRDLPRRCLACPQMNVYRPLAGARLRGERLNGLVDRQS